MTAELVATYRLQLGPAFGFDDAAAIADYLARLGVSHVYLSPYMQAAPGSEHGYDVVDPTRVGPELGGPEAHARMCDAFARRGLGHVVDVVPNHTAALTPDNPWWWDVLEHGPRSAHAHRFDIHWRSSDARLWGKVLLPVLGDHYGRVLESGDLRLEREGPELRLRVYDRPFPLSSAAIGELLGRAARRGGSEELAFLADALVDEGMAEPAAAAQRPAAGGEGPHAHDPEAGARRHRRDRRMVERHLGRLLEQEPALARTLDGTLAELNADRQGLDRILARQHYRLAWWRTARHELNYRRFFDIHDLVALRMEDRRVFEDVHETLLRWVAAGKVDGLRIDHADGLRDPVAYFRWLREDAPQAWIVAEKILQPGEELPTDWPIDGTTGYDFVGITTGLFVDSDAEGPLTEIYERFTGEPVPDFRAVAHDAKRHVLHTMFGSELRRVTERLQRVCERHPRQRDYTISELGRVVEELIVGMPVYRTYLRPGEHGRSADQRYVEQALQHARSRRRDLSPELVAFVGDLLRGRLEGDEEGRFVAAFQQLSGPAMAKGLEDTAFYRFHRLVCLNEVGADPAQFGTGIDAFHRHCARIQERWPRTMLASSTHDTKRSEDVRARIALLSEIPERWHEAVMRWAEVAARHRTGSDWPDRQMEYLLYQTLVGAWPISAERLATFAHKAAREAKVHTSWYEPNPKYEEALQRFVHGLVGDETFNADLERFIAPLLEPARLTSLAQLLLKLTAPGVPDIYQGNELWEHSLVDPDNRHAVDFQRRRELLSQLEGLTVGEVSARADEGLPKLWVTARALAVRRAAPEAFGPEGAYAPLWPRGLQAHRLVAFRRGNDVVTVVPRLVLDFDRQARDTVVPLPAGTWHDALSGARVQGGDVPVAELLSPLGVALLVREEGG